MNWKFPYYNNTRRGADWDTIHEDFEWFRKLVYVPQDPIWHSEGNVQLHTILVVEHLINLTEFKWLSELEQHILFTAALFHDIEKASTTTTEFRDGRECIVAPKHAQRGEVTTREILYKEFDVPFQIREEICSLVRYHGVPLWSTDDDTIHQKLIKISQRCNMKLLGILSKADILGRIAEDNDSMLERIEFFVELCKENNCYEQPKQFTDNYNRFKYLNNVNYNPNTCHDYFQSNGFTVHMMSGIAGSGKDTYINHKFSNLPMISLDDIRKEFKFRRGSKKNDGKVYQIAKERCKIHMRKSEDFLFNATNLTQNMRSKWIREFTDYGAFVNIHYIEVPYKQLLLQNRNRIDKVPTRAVDKMIKTLEIPQYDECIDVNYLTQL